MELTGIMSLGLGFAFFAAVAGVSATMSRADDKTAAGPLQGKRVAILATDGVEEAELTKPREALNAAGAETVLVSPAKGQINAWNGKDWGHTYAVDMELDNANPAQFDALVLPGGVMNPDKLRMNPKAVQFAKSFLDAGKPVAAICHGPWLLVEAGVVRGRTLTSWPSIQTDIRNAGGKWTDSEVVTDHGLVTSRKPADLPAFNKKMIEEIAEGKHKEGKR